MPSIQFIALAALCVHYSSLSILIHLSRTGQQQSNYRASSAVLITESLKLVISLILAIFQSLVQLKQHSSRPSPHARFEPQFESLTGEDQFDQNHQLQDDRSETHPNHESIRSKWNDQADQLITDVINQIQANSSKLRERTVSNDENQYLSNQTAKRRRLISSSGTTHSDKLTAERLEPSIPSNFDPDPDPDLDHSHRMSVQASPQLIHPTQTDPTSTYPIHQALLHLRQSVFSQDWTLLSIPALMFIIQNNLQYLAASNLTVPIFQITYQLKILTTALCSVMILKRSLRKTQWISLILLTIGVAIVQLNSKEIKPEKKETTSIDLSKTNPSLGLVAVILACLSSGFASVYLERLLKSNQDPRTTMNLKKLTHHHQTSSPSSFNLEPNKRKSIIEKSWGFGRFKNRLNKISYNSSSYNTTTLSLTPSKSIWIRNIQLSSFGLIISIILVLIEDRVNNPIEFILTSISRTFSRTGLQQGDQSTRLTSQDHQKILKGTWKDEFSFEFNSRTKTKSALSLLLLNRIDFFKGFTSLTWIVIIFQVTGGLLNSMVMKYSNNINKNFSICLSIILSILLTNLFSLFNSNPSSDLFVTNNNHLNLQFCIGASFVLLSTWLFNL